MLFSLLALLTSNTAHAGFGVTGYVASVETSLKNEALYVSPQHVFPSLDYRAGKFIIQFAGLELFRSLANDDDTLFGVNAYYSVVRRKMTNNVSGIVQLGLSFDYDQAGDELNYTTLLGGARFGAQIQDNMGFGIYVVPELGLNIAGGDLAERAREDQVEGAVGGQIQVSVWLGSK